MSKLKHFGAVAVLALGLAGAAVAADVQGTGLVKAVDAKAGTVTISHEPIRIVMISSQRCNATYSSWARPNTTRPIVTAFRMTNCCPVAAV